MSKIRGLQANQEQRASALVRDTRSLGARLSDFFREGTTAASIIAFLGCCSFFFPAFIEIYVLLGVLNLLYINAKKLVLPYRLPESCGLPDFNDPKPGGNVPYLARGITHVANELLTDKEVWFNNEDMRTHMLIFGSTGSGKTVALTSLAYNSLVQGSGFIYVDGKGDTSLYANMFSLCRTMGREDDLLIINFMTGARDIVGPQKSRISNTMNPFARGSSGMLTNLIVSMMGGNSNSGDGDMWKNRAISFVEALMKILVYMRDLGHILLDANSIRLYFTLPKLESIALDKKFPLEDDRFISIQDAPELVLEPLFNYLQTLPGFNPANKGKQSGEVWEQHGFIVMQLTRTFSSLADTYGHIIRTNLAEVDFKDVVLNRRILVVLLPALEKSPEELANLGKVIVASIKGMMASGLGEEVEGSYRDVIERKPTNAPTPFVCILDEYGYYAVPGFAVVPAQARSLGFAAIFAGQDLPAFQKASKEEAASIGANTNIKICMKLEDPAETYEFFSKTAGQAYVTRTGGFQSDAGSMSNSYSDNKNAQVEKQDRIDLMDLKDQRPGEMHIFFKSQITRAKTFFANPRPAPYLRINQHLKIEKPDGLLLTSMKEKLFKLQEIFKNPNKLNLSIPLDEDLVAISNFLKAHEKENTIVKTVNAIKSLHQQEVEEESVEEPIAESQTQEEDFSGMDIFTLELANVSEDTAQILYGPLLERKEIKKQIEKIERFSGNTKAKSQEIADKIIADLRTATHYPPADVKPNDVADVISAINELIAKLGS